MEPLMPINQARTPLKRRQLLCQGLLSLSHAVGFIAGLLLCCAATMAGLRGASIMPSHSGTHSAIESGAISGLHRADLSPQSACSACKAGSGHQVAPVALSRCRSE